MIARRAACLAALSMLAACATVTEIPLQWRNPEYQGGPFRKILVIGVAEKDATRRVFEERFAKAIAKRGTAATASYSLLPETSELGEERIRGAIAGGGYDGVIVTRLLAVDEQTRYVPPRTYTVPSTYGGHGYYGYYHTSWDVVHEPGYYKTDTVVRLETNLYTVRETSLVWSGQSATTNPRDVSDGIDSMTAAVARDLAREGLLGGGAGS